MIRKVLGLSCVNNFYIIVIFASRLGLAVRGLYFFPFNLRAIYDIIICVNILKCSHNAPRESERNRAKTGERVLCHVKCRPGCE